MKDLQEEYRPGCGPHKRDEKKDFEAVAKLLMTVKTFTSATIQRSLAMSYFNVQQILSKMEKLGIVSTEKKRQNPGGSRCSRADEKNDEDIVQAVFITA